MDNELQRQQLEERSARVQASMLSTLGRPEEAIARRRSRVQALARLDSEMAGLDGEEVERREGRQGQPRPVQSCNLEQLYHEALPLERALSHSGPPALGSLGSLEEGSVLSFTSSVHSVGEERREAWGPGHDTRQEAANSLMALLGCSDMERMSRTLLAMSSSPANCDMMRGSRCIPLLVQLLHVDPAHPANPRPARPVRARAARSLHNIVHAHPTDKHCKREAKVLKLLEVLRQYCDFLRDVLEAGAGSGAGKAAVRVAGCRRVAIQVSSTTVSSMI